MSQEESLDSFTGVPDDPGVETFMWHMFKNNKFKDSFDAFFVLNTKDGQKVLSAHKMMLAVWSPKFEDMFYREDKKDNRIELNDVNPDAFEDMLKFIYCCEPVLESCEKAYELYKVAVQFDIAYLITLCQNFFRKIEVNVTNVFDIFEIAEVMQDQYLMNKCMDIIQKETKEIISHYDCCDVLESMIHIILRSPKLSLDSEFELLIWIFSWAKNRLLDYSVDNLREVLDEFLPRLQFLALTNTEFATICRYHDDFFKEKEALSIFMNIAIRGSCPLPEWYDTNAKARQYTGQQVN